MLLNDMHTDRNAADEDLRDGIFVCATDGNGYWSREVREVRVTELRLGYVSKEGDFAELCVHFNTDDWRVDKDGLIYTDRQFLQDLRDSLNLMGLAGNDVDYSEHGMQGDNYVSCDAGAEFVASYKAKFADKYVEAHESCNG